MGKDLPMHPSKSYPICMKGRTENFLGITPPKEKNPANYHQIKKKFSLRAQILW